MRHRTKALGFLFAVLLALVGGLTWARSARAASLVEVTNFGYNPTNLRMYEYVPNSATAHPPILVVSHYCTGSGPAMYSGRPEFPRLADEYGFIIVYPSATRSGSCFDVSTAGALKHDGNSDPAGIVSMVQWEEQHRGADASRVYATGESSGAMMTNVLLGDYPDVFKAGAAFAGVPFGCFATTDGSLWNSACANGQISKTPQQWGDIVRAAYPGYTGPRPRMEVWHGTADTTLNYNDFGEELKEWTNVLGVSQTPSFTDHPQSAWTRTRYGGTGTMAPVEGVSVSGAGHGVYQTGMGELALRFMGLIGGTTSPTPTPTPTPTPPGGGHTGPGTTCKVTDSINAWNTGLTSSITVTNTGGSAIDGWKLAFTLPSGQTITQGWGATYSPSSGQVTATNVSYDATIPAGGSVTIGFQANHTGDTSAPSSFTLNYESCL